MTNPRRTAPYWLAPAVPALALFLAVYVPSLAILAVLSFFKFVPGQLPVPGLTLANYARFILDPYYLGLMLNTLYLAAVASVIAVAMSYPLAYSLVRSPGLRRIILPAVTISFFVSAILRLYGWIGILGENGVINSSLISLGIVSSPLPILFTDRAVIIGLADFAIPYAVLILASSISNIDASLEQAAQNLGATQWQTFLRITLPLTAPGLVAALVLSFAQAVSAFITPLLLGGGRVPMLATQVYDSMIYSVNYPFASATVVVILAVILLITYSIGRAGHARRP